MIRLPSRVTFPVALAVLLMSLLTSVVVASAPWNGSCDSGEMCGYYDASFNGPMAAMAGNNLSYNGETYPGINWGVNDSFSSLKNRTASDLIMRHEINYGGASYCLNAGWQDDFVTLWHNDAFSSHFFTPSGC